MEAGLAEPCYRGPEGYCAYITATYEVWGDGVDMPMRAQASGIALAQTYATVATLKDGLVITQRDFLDQAEALQAAGLSA